MDTEAQLMIQWLKKLMTLPKESCRVYTNQPAKIRTASKSPTKYSKRSKEYKGVKPQELDWSQEADSKHSIRYDVPMGICVLHYK